MSRRLVFPVETNFPVAQQLVISIRKQKQAQGSETAAAGQKYLSSQYYADSSLSQDVSQSSFFAGERNEDSQPTEEEIHVPNRSQVKTEEVNKVASAEGLFPLIEKDYLLAY